MMIKLKSLILLLVLFFGNVMLNAQDLETLMTTGNDFFQNKEYEEAIKSYESILQQGYLSADLYYNLGNSYFRIGAIGNAILFYERALKISPSHEDAAYNLTIANARIVDKIQEIPPLFFIKWWNILLSTFTSTKFKSNQMSFLSTSQLFHLLILFSPNYSLRLQSGILFLHELQKHHYFVNREKFLRSQRILRVLHNQMKILFPN